MLDKCLYPRHSSRSLTLGVSLQNDNKLKARHTDREGVRAAGWACGRAFPFGKGVLMRHALSHNSTLCFTSLPDGWLMMTYGPFYFVLGCRL